MNNKEKLEIFTDENIDYLNNLMESKKELLESSTDYKQVERKLYDKIEDLESTLPKKYKEKYSDLITTFYEYENYVQVFAYMLGVKFHKNLEKLG